MLAHLGRGAIALAVMAVVSDPLHSQVTITGTVRASRHDPLSAAVVQVRGTAYTVQTTESGRYRLMLAESPESVTVVARRIGFVPQSRHVKVRGSTVSVDFVLAPGPRKVSEVIVTDEGAPVTVLDRARKMLARRERRGFASRDAAMPASAEVAVSARAEVAGDAKPGAGGRGVRHDPQPGVLTAAVWDDVANWSQYQRFVARAEESSWNRWGLETTQLQRRPARHAGRPRSERRALDLGFLVDATGSMGDEMTFLQTELKDIVRRVRGSERDLDIRVSVVFYRDRGDDFLTRSLPFTRDIDSAVSFIAGASAGGGGDFPEDMNAGLEAIMRQPWSRDAIPQMLFLLADAPPQQYGGADYTFHEAIADASASGMAIYPVAASGVDKPTEFLFRAMAAMTGGKYVFLTDDSGVGNSHEIPDIAGYNVEKLNDLMVREIRSFVASRIGR